MSSDLIPAINWADFVKIVNAGRVHELKACEVLLDGEHPFTAIIFHGDRYGSDNIRINAEFLANRSNIIGGQDPEEVLASLPRIKYGAIRVAIPSQEFQGQEQSLYDKRVAAMAHAREVRKAKRELVKV